MHIQFFHTKPTKIFTSLTTLIRSSPYFHSIPISLFTTVTQTQEKNHLFSLLSNCCHSNHICQTHGFMVLRGLDQDNILLSKFIDTCSTLCLLNYAYSVFSHKTHKNIYLYNTIIKVFSCYQSSAHEAVLLYKEALGIGLKPDSYTFPFVLKAVGCVCEVKLGVMIHCHVVGVGLDLDVHVGVGLMRMYALCGCVGEARKVFDEMFERDLACWNAMVVGYVKVGDVDSARGVFEEMPERDVVSWTAVIAGYAQMDRPSEAIVVFRRMLVEGVKPDEVAMLAGLSACADTGALDLGEWIHNYIDKHRLRKTVPLQNALIDMYAKCGDIRNSVLVFENMKQRSVVTWTTIIAGLALNGLGREALEMFTRMERANITPNDVTLIGVLSACSHDGLVEMGRWYFNSMHSRYGIKPKIQHYGCMIDLLGRAGCLQEAQELLREMPFEANEAIWGSLLAASRKHGDVELGERALQHLIKLEPHNSGNYSLLSNIYAAFGQWNDAGMTRKVMRDMGVMKMPGMSCIEVDNIVHEFNAGDKSHPQSERIYKLLLQINGQLKMAGYMHRKCWELFEIESISCQQDLA